MLIWKNVKFDIPVRDPEKAAVPVAGKQVGKFAVHKSIDHKTKWTVTHIPTGLKLIDMSTKQGCVRLVEELSKRIYGFPYMSRDRLVDNKKKIQSVVVSMAAEE